MNSFGQQKRGEQVLTLGVGQSLIGSFVNIALQAEAEIMKQSSSDVAFDSYNLPVLNGMLDFGMFKWFSVGVATSYQKFGGKFYNYRFINGQGIQIKEDFEMGLTRWNVGLRGLFHFGKSETLDFYAGMRQGITIWQLEHNSTDPNLFPDLLYQDQINFAVQGLFGCRAYVSDFIAVNAEVALGTAPYLAAGGISFRF